MVFRDTKNTEYTGFDFRKPKKSILTYKKGLPYGRYTDGYTKNTEYTRFDFGKSKNSILTYKKGLPY